MRRIAGWHKEDIQGHAGSDLPHLIIKLNHVATYILRKDSSKHYYWILKSSENQKIIAMSSESYESESGAKDSIEWTRANAKGAGFKDETYAQINQSPLPPK